MKETGLDPMPHASLLSASACATRIRSPRALGEEHVGVLGDARWHRVVAAPHRGERVLALRALHAVERNFSIGALATTAKLIRCTRWRAAPSTASMIDVQDGHGVRLSDLSGYMKL